MTVEAAVAELVKRGRKKEDFTEDHAKLYELIRDRLVVSFMVSNRYLQYKLEIEEDKDGAVPGVEWADSAVFRASVKVDLERGYLDYLKGKGQDESGDEREEEETLSERLDEGKLRGLLEKLEDMDLPRIKRPKPKYYTGATLVTAMQRCGKDVVNPKYKKMLTETKGIGTPATQSSFPETLMKKGYIVEEGGNYKSTEKGRKLIEIMPFKIKTPEITAEMELQLKLVECGEISVREFCHGFEKFCEEFTEDMRSLVGKVAWSWATKAKEQKSEHGRGEDTGLKCPKCGKPVLETASIFVCEGRKSVKNAQGTYDNSGCEFVVYKKFRGKEGAITRAKLVKLLKGEQVKVSGLVSKAGKEYDTMVYWDSKTGKLESVVEGKVEKLDLECVFCGSSMVGNERGFKCTCGFAVYRNGSSQLTEAVVRELFEKGETRDKIEGFVTRDGKKMSPTRLRLNRELKKVEYVFD